MIILICGNYRCLFKLSKTSSIQRLIFRKIIWEAIATQTYFSPLELEVCGMFFLKGGGGLTLPKIPRKGDGKLLKGRGNPKKGAMLLI